MQAQEFRSQCKVLIESKAVCKVLKKTVFLLHFRPWDLSRKMRREISIDFATGIIDFENKNISMVQKQ